MNDSSRLGDGRLRVPAPPDSLRARTLEAARRTHAEARPDTLGRGPRQLEPSRFGLGRRRIAWSAAAALLLAAAGLWLGQLGSPVSVGPASGSPRDDAGAILALGAPAWTTRAPHRSTSLAEARRHATRDTAFETTPDP